MPPSPLKPGHAQTSEIPHDFLAQIKDHIANRRIEAGLRCLTAHKEIDESIQPHQNNSVFVLGHCGQWVDAGLPGAPLLKHLLSYFSNVCPETLSPLEYAHLRMVDG